MAANGERIHNKGQKILTLATSEGVIRRMAFQVCKSSKALGSVSKMCKAGHRVVFDDDGSYIQDKNAGEHSDPAGACNVQRAHPH